MTSANALSVTQVAKRKHVSRQAVVRWCQLGKIKAEQDRWGNWLIEPEDLDAFKRTPRGRPLGAKNKKRTPSKNADL